MKSQSKILVAVIAYNEEKNIGIVLNELRENLPDYDIVVVDNGSTDGTVDVCKKMNISYISHFTNSGGSMGTVLSYFSYAHHYEYDAVCQVDGDGQHMASEVKKILQPIEQNQADYVIGSRFLECEGFQSSFWRRQCIHLFSSLLSLLIGQRIKDITSGFKAYNKKMIHLFAVKYGRELMDINQMLLIAHFAGGRITEVPVTMRPRLHGTSEFNFINSIKFPLKGIINIMGCVLQMKRY